MRVSDIRHPQAKIWVSLSLRKIHTAEQKCLQRRSVWCWRREMMSFRYDLGTDATASLL